MPQSKGDSEQSILGGVDAGVQPPADDGDRVAQHHAQEVGVARPHPHQRRQVADKSVSGTGEELNTNGKLEQEGEKNSILSNGIITERQRSTDSFTFSSSPSEGEAPTSSEGTSQGEDQRTKVSIGNHGKSSKPQPSSSSAGKSKKSSKKQSKKSKKSQKKDKGHGGGQSSSTDQQARSKRISKRRAYVLERIRSDSLTSSDEEHCLASSETSSGTDSGMSSLLHQDSILEEGESGVVDIEKLKQHLQRRIMAKKPPAQFETPATHPVFHEVPLY